MKKGKIELGYVKKIYFISKLSSSEESTTDSS